MKNFLALLLITLSMATNVFAGVSVKIPISIDRIYYSSEFGIISSLVESELVQQAELKCGSIEKIDSLHDIKFSFKPSAPVINSDITEGPFSQYKMLLSYPRAKASANVICK